MISKIIVSKLFSSKFLVYLVMPFGYFLGMRFLRYYFYYLLSFQYGKRDMRLENLFKTKVQLKKKKSKESQNK